MFNNAPYQFWMVGQQGFLIKDFLTHYHAYGQGNSQLMPPLRIHYKDYTSWQESQLETLRLQSQRDYWLAKLTPVPVRLNLPVDYPRPPVKSFQGNTITWQPEPELIDTFEKLVKAQEASLFMGLVSLVKSFLFRYTEQNEITIGSAIAGRNHPDLEDQIGFYVNTLVLRDQITDHDSFTDVLSKVKTTTLEADYILLRQAARYLARMPKNDQIRLLEALDTLISDSTKLDIKPLYGRDELRLRVGKYRVLFFEDRDNNLYVITTIKPRGDVYK
nr:unnamed protein product [Microcystis aeruginosa PCC 7806]